MATLTIDPESRLARVADTPEEWGSALLHTDNSVVFGTTLTDLVASLIDDYPMDGGLPALEARYDFAVDAAGQRQAFQAFAARQEGTFDETVESEEVLTSIFSAKDLHVPEFEVWGHQVPLVLIATDYAPATARPRPEGNIQWIDPATELTLLKSLAALGDFELFIRE